MIKIEHITTYFPYKIECELLKYESDYVGEKYGVIDEIRPLYLRNKEKTNCWHVKTIANSLSAIEDIKLNLKPLNLLTDEFDDITKGAILFSEKSSLLPYNPNDLLHQSLRGLDFKKLIKNHYDCFNLIKNGFANDITKIIR